MAHETNTPYTHLRLPVQDNARNLINIAYEVAAYRTACFSVVIQFISSSTVVASHPQQTSQPLVLEKMMTIELISEGGKAETKVVSE